MTREPPRPAPDPDYATDLAPAVSREDAKVYEYGPSEALPTCAEHDPAHPVYQGRCYALGRHAGRPLRIARSPHACTTCGLAVYAAVVTRSRRRYDLEAETFKEHWCPPRAQVELDPERLAAGIALALDALIARRRPQRDFDREPERPARPAPPDATPVRPPPPPDPSGWVPSDLSGLGLPVYSPDAVADPDPAAFWDRSPRAPAAGAGEAGRGD